MRKQLDPRIPYLINNNVKLNHRSFIVLVGDKGRDQVCSAHSSPILQSFPIIAYNLTSAVIGCEPAFSSLTGPCICETFSTMVL